MKYITFQLLNIFILNEDIKCIKHTFDELINIINDVPYNSIDYDYIISYILEALKNHYVFFGIAKNAPINIVPVDLESEFKKINTKNITFYEFYKNVSTITFSLKDLYTKVIFSVFEKITFNAPLL